MLAENPIIIQGEDENGDLCSDQVPLFLIHDGGGTVYSYFLMGALGRVVYGISNPHFGTAKKWHDGIPGMARTYARLIKDTVCSGDILLGGWSLGGLISIEIAHVLAKDFDINVRGIVMIDSLCPLDKIGYRQERQCLRRLVSMKGVMAQKTKACMQEAVGLIESWTLPRWVEIPSEIEPSTFSLQPYQCENGAKRALSSPPTIVLRAVESSSSPEPSSRSTQTSKTMGWDQYADLLLHTTFEVAGNHFTLFDTNNVIQLTETLKLSCDLLTGDDALLKPVETVEY